MSPVAMAIMLAGLTALFLVTAQKRFALLATGREIDRFDSLGDRVAGTIDYAFLQRKMGYYTWAGLAHKVIFGGFIVLLLNTLVLWGRGFDPSFNLWILGPDGFLGLPLGHLYDFAKDIVMVLVIAGALGFLYLRVVKQEARMTKSGEAIVILFIIMSMMIGDMAYAGAAQVLYAERWAEVCAAGNTPGLCESVGTVAAHLGDMPAQAATPGYSPWPTPASSLFAMMFLQVDTTALVWIAHAGFWIHATLVMIFLNLLPLSKHFHVITAIPNVFVRDLKPAKLAFVGNSEQIEMKVMGAYEAMESGEPAKQPVGVGNIREFSWKAILDFYTCTECGRCSDHCPAHRTGKILSPKQLTINLRDHMYDNQEELIQKGLEGPPMPADWEGHEDSDDESEEEKPITQLVGDVIHPDVLWACTTCRACEEQCPVMISYVDKIVDMRRNLVLIRGEVPQEASNAIQNIQTNGNPWNISQMDRGNWADGLGIPTMADKPGTPVLYWVGCSASYDDRSKKIARATASLMLEAGVDFAILGEEETCTGDPARRAGDEYTFIAQAEVNAATLNGYKEQGGIAKIVTTCPHCFNTLANEYPDFDAKFEVVHHSAFLDELVAKGKLKPKKPLKEKVVFHDSCYLGRYNDHYDQPRNVLKVIPGIDLAEVEGASRNKGLCCGAGGMQMFMEEQNKDRMNVRRTLQLLDTGAKTIASACPFCTTMLTDGLKSQNKEEEIRQVDIAELLADSCGVGGEKKKPVDDAAE